MGSRGRPSLRRWSMFAVTWHFSVWVGWGLVLWAVLMLDLDGVADNQAALLMLFALVHVFMLLVTGPWNHVRSMISGRYRIDTSHAESRHEAR